MIDDKIYTFLMAVEEKNFTRAAEKLSLTQPAVSHHISQLEKEMDVQLFVRKKGELSLTREGEIVLRYARRVTALDTKMRLELTDSVRNVSNLRIGITHTSESNLVTEALARYSNENPQIVITIVTDTIKNLYSMVENFELDMAIVEGRNTWSNLNSIMLDSDYLVCAMSNRNPLAKQGIVTLPALKKERLILRLPTSATRILFESTLESINESLASFNVTLEVDNIATIKDLVRKDLGVSILARSTCLDELMKGKITALPIENLNMLRETNIVYHRTFVHTAVLNDIAKMYHATAKRYHR